jgi:hypothetical protein
MFARAGGTSFVRAVRTVARPGRKWAVALVIVQLGCGRVGFDAVALADDDAATPDGADAGPLVCGAWGPVELVPELSSLSTDFGPAVSADGNEIYLHSDRVGSRDIYMATRNGSVFGTPMTVTEISDPGFDDGSPATTADDLEIYFDSHRVGGLPCIYTASRNVPSGPWMNVMRLDSLCSPDHAAGVHVSADGLRLYYTRLIGGNVEGTIMISTRGSRLEAFDAGAPLPGVWLGVDIGYPTLTTDELEIYFESGNPLELYVARRDAIGDPFGTPELAVELNSVNLDVDPAITSDGKTMYLASDRPGGLSGTSGYDIWRATRTCN